MAMVPGGRAAGGGAGVGGRRRYDFVGAFALAFVTGLGGALIRDGIFLQQGPPAAVRNSGYVAAVLLATVVGACISQMGRRLTLLVTVFDAVGLSVYAVVGADRSLAAGLGHLGAVLVGVTNAIGGGMLRDLIIRQEPVLFKPGQFYAVAALAAAVFHVAGRAGMELNAQVCATLAACAGVAVRLLAVRYNWRTRPLYWQDWMRPEG